MQLAFAEHLKERRKKEKMSREALAKKKHSTCIYNKKVWGYRAYFIQAAIA